MLKWNGECSGEVSGLYPEAKFTSVCKGFGFQLAKRAYNRVSLWSYVVIVGMLWEELKLKYLSGEKAFYTP